MTGHPANGQSLELDDIVAAALRVGVSKGFEALTMRALAEELGVSAMATYHHVRNKTALFDLIIDSVLEPVEIPPSGFGDWSARLRELQRRSSELLQAWPGLDVLIFSRPPTAQGWRLTDGYLRILLDGGFTPRNAVLAFGVLHSHAMGRTYVVHHLPDGSAGPGQNGQNGQVGQVGQAGRRRDWPVLRELDNFWPLLHDPDVSAFGEKVIMDGLRVMLAEQDPGG